MKASFFRCSFMCFWRVGGPTFSKTEIPFDRNFAWDLSSVFVEKGSGQNDD